MIILPTMRPVLGGFSPLSLAPALWLDASDPATLYDATSGGNTVAVDGAVARWEDKSGNNRHATQATSANRPLRKAEVRNGRDVVRFDGSNDYLASVAFGGSESWTRFLVAASRNDSQYTILLGWGNSYASPNPGADYMAVNAKRVEIVLNGNGATLTKFSSRLTNGTPLSSGTFSVLCQQAASTHVGHVLRVNGAVPDGTSSYSNNPGTFTKTSTAYGIGGYNGGGGNCAADIAEAIHFPYALTTEQIQQVESYLNAKWAAW